MTVKIYMLRDPRTREIRYIGKTTRPLHVRLSGHCSDARGRYDSHACRWVGSILDRNERPLIELIDEVEESDWEQAEREYIQLGKMLGLRLTNYRLGGLDAGPRNPNRQAISDRMKGNQYARGPQSEETRAKKSATWKGRTNNPNLGGWNKGKKLVVIDGKRRYI